MLRLASLFILAALPATNAFAQAETASAFIEAGLRRSNHKDYKGAISDYNIAITYDSTDAIVYFDRGYAEDKLGNYHQAIRDYNRALALSPDDADVYVDRGLTYDNLGNLPQALRDFDKALLLHPNYPPALLHRGMVKNERSDYSAAIEDFNLALKYKPKYVKAYMYRGEARVHMKDYIRAIKDYDTAIRLNGKLELLYLKRSAVEIDLNEFKAAGSDLDIANALDPRDPFAFDIRGILAEREGNSDLAIQYYTKAIQFKPDFAEAFHARGYQYYRKVNLQAALADLSRDLELDPKDGWAYQWRGHIKWILKMKDPCADFHKAADFHIREAEDAIKQFCQ